MEKSKNKSNTKDFKNISVVYNKELVGIELYFKEKPNQDIIDGLKEKKFRWNRTKQCWYAKDNQDNRDFVNTLLGKYNGSAKASKQASKPINTKTKPKATQNLELNQVNIITYNGAYYDMQVQPNGDIHLIKIK